MHDNISTALITAFEQHYDTRWDDAQLRNERLAWRAAWNAAQAAPVTPQGEWRIDTSAGREILVYKNCSVIEDADARYVLSLIAAASQPAAVAPFGYVNTYTGQFLYDVEPCCKDNEGHWRTVYLQPATVSPRSEYPPLPEHDASSIGIGLLWGRDKMHAYFDLGRQPVAAPALEAPAAPALDAKAIAVDVCQRVADMDDRSSPADWPEAMLVTGPELVEIVEGEIAQAMANAVAAPIMPTALHVAARYWQWLEIMGRLTSFSTFVNEFGYEKEDCKQVYEQVVLPCFALLAAAPQAQASAPDWWRKRADEIEAQVATTGSSDAMRCYTDMRTLLQSAAAPQAPAAPREFQQRVQPWLMECFGPAISNDKQERNHRFLEEALETVQAGGCTASEAHQLVDYVFGRPVGELGQEVGGAMTTLAALCLANGIDMHAEAEKELARVWTMVEKIRAKQAAKPKHSPLPAAPAAPAVDASSDTALLDAMQRHRIALVPEFEGPWDAEIFNDEAEAHPIASGNTPREALRAALAAQAKEGGA
ncbi:hypothetical protein ACUTR7_00250 [Delftia sp. NA_296.1]|uniref:hypothetical protein n=1 Tax=Delftia sp. NA_296.1 TaxID=3415648 RepID=UPI0040468400